MKRLRMGRSKGRPFLVRLHYAEQLHRVPDRHGKRDGERPHQNAISVLHCAVTFRSRSIRAMSFRTLSLPRS